jgi:NAD(P)-dependent dehydrogenase (short-subunit alcohol dehydrogenase family)
VTWIVEVEAKALEDELESPDRLILIETDVTDEASVGSTVSELGPVDALVHLVGAWKGGETVAEHSVETWVRMFNLNLLSAFLCCRSVLPSMLEKNWGRMVLVSSRTARQGRAGQAAYAIAKAGVAVLAETIAEETRGTGVTANVVAPSTLDTPANRKAMPNADHSAWVPPSDVAAAISFLTSEEAGQLRGAWLPVYGSA